MAQGKTYNKSPRRINHKAPKSKTNTGTTFLKWSITVPIPVKNFAFLFGYKPLYWASDSKATQTKNI